jgi:Tfp pilus assembly protein FimT
MLELLVVMAILVLLAVVVLPSIGAFRGDTRQRAAADAIRGELAVARARAAEEGKPYRVAISRDGTRIRRAPDGPDFATVAGAEHPGGSARVVDYPFEQQITAEVVTEQDAQVESETDDWVTIALVMPDGTCRADNVVVSLKEDGRQGLFVRVRGLTGTSRVVTNPNGSGSGSGGTR